MGGKALTRFSFSRPVRPCADPEVLTKASVFLSQAAANPETQKSLVDLAKHVFTHPETLQVRQTGLRHTEGGRKTIVTYVTTHAWSRLSTQRGVVLWQRRMRPTLKSTCRDALGPISPPLALAACVCGWVGGRW